MYNKKINNLYYRDNEYSILSNHKYNNLCKVYGKYKIDNYIYLILPFYENGDYLEYLNINYMDELQIKSNFFEMVYCVKNLHETKNVHLDIKLDNFFLDKNKKLILGDFGCAQYLNNNNSILIPNKLNFGTDGYLAPEVSIGYFNYSSDIWSLGVCLYAMLHRNKLYQNVNTYIGNEYNFYDNELLNDILKPKPFERITIDDILNHKWLN